MAYNEIEKRGTEDFPFAFFHLDEGTPRYIMAAHWHAEIELIRVLKGEFHVTLNKETYIAREGDIVFVNRETVHQGMPHSAVYDCLVFHGEFLYQDAFDSCAFIKSLLEGECIIDPFFPASKSKTYAALSSVFDAVLSSGASRKFRVISAFYDFFAAALEEKRFARSLGGSALSNDQNIHALKKGLAFLRQNYDKPISLSQFSAAMHKSPGYAGSFFKNMTGKTPMEYLVAYRIEKACHKLRSTDLSVTEIAFSSGFSDVSYFIKMFKKAMGISPGKYRKM